MILHINPSVLFIYLFILSQRTKYFKTITSSLIFLSVISAEWTCPSAQSTFVCPLQEWQGRDEPTSYTHTPLSTMGAKPQARESQPNALSGPNEGHAHAHTHAQMYTTAPGPTPEHSPVPVCLLNPLIRPCCSPSNVVNRLPRLWESSGGHIPIVFSILGLKMTSIPAAA